MGAGFEKTEYLTNLGASQTQICSKKEPVQTTQWRSAPTPRPNVSARIGYATPARNIHSFGAGISVKAMTLFQTSSGGASISRDERTSKTGEGVATACSSHSMPGANRSRIATNAASF